MLRHTQPGTIFTITMLFSSILWIFPIFLVNASFNTFVNRRSSSDLDTANYLLNSKSSSMIDSSHTSQSDATMVRNHRQKTLEYLDTIKYQQPLQSPESQYGGLAEMDGATLFLILAAIFVFIMLFGNPEPYTRPINATCAK